MDCWGEICASGAPNDFSRSSETPFATTHFPQEPFFILFHLLSYYKQNNKKHKKNPFICAHLRFGSTPHFFLRFAQILKHSTASRLRDCMMLMLASGRNAIYQRLILWPELVPGNYSHDSQQGSKAQITYKKPTPKSLTAFLPSFRTNFNHSAVYAEFTPESRLHDSQQGKSCLPDLQKR